MGRSFVKHTVAGVDKYLIWSSIVDAPITYGGTLEQIRNYWKSEFGRVGLEELDRDIASGRKWWRTVEEMVDCNRAGKDETKLTAEAIVKHFFVDGPKKPVPTGESWQKIFEREDREEKRAAVRKTRIR